MEVVVQLERALDELARRWDRFLAREPGAAKPSGAEIDAIEQRLRQSGVGHTLSAAERTRLDHLTARFNTKAASWRQLTREPEQKPVGAPPAKPGTRPQPASAVASRPASGLPPTGPASSTTAPPKGGIDAARMEEYRHLFARYQAVMERAGETLPTSLERFVRELEEQRRRLEERGTLVVGFEIVREASGVHVRPRTRSRSG
jgi:hypothetical protein